MKKWISVLVALVVALAFMPVIAAQADGNTVVSISAPANVAAGGTFIARVNFTQVTDLNAYQIQVNYDSSVIQVIGPEGGASGVTAGLIGSTSIHVDNWAFVPPGASGGAIKVLGRIPSNEGVSGSGYLAEIHFNVLGAAGRSSALTPTDVPGFSCGVFNSGGNRITTVTPWSPTSVLVFQPLQINTSSLPEATIGVPYSVNLSGTGGTFPYTWNATGLPTGLSISGSGTISGNPTASGDFNVNITVTDSAGIPATASKSLTLHVFTSLQIITASLPEATRGVAYSYTLNSSGGKSPFTWSATGLPAGLSLSTAGNLTGTPSGSGDFTINFTVTDSFNPANTVSKSLILHVYGAFQITTAALPQGMVGGAYSASVVATGGKAPFTWSATGLPGGLTLYVTTGNISGTPNSAGDFNVTVNVYDNSNPANYASTSLTLHVVQNLVITTVSLPAGVAGRAYSTASLAAQGGVPSYSWSASGLPAGMSISTSGAISGTPNAAGDYNVNISVTDSSSPSNMTSTTVTLKIYLAGDANSDGQVTMGDVTKVERMILGLDLTVPWADANGDGNINIGDVTKIERIVLGLS